MQNREDNEEVSTLTESKIDATPGHYPRYCKGKFGPHLIRGPEDETWHQYSRGYVKTRKLKKSRYLTCKLCYRAHKRKAQAKWRETSPLGYVNELNGYNRRRRRAKQQKEG